MDIKLQHIKYTRILNEIGSLIEEIDDLSLKSDMTISSYESRTMEEVNSGVTQLASGASGANIEAAKIKERAEMIKRRGQESQETTSALEQIASAAESQAETAERLNELIHLFKI